jgi:hypothetical protein
MERIKGDVNSRVRWLKPVDKSELEPALPELTPEEKLKRRKETWENLIRLNDELRKKKSS